MIEKLDKEVRTKYCGEFVVDDIDTNVTLMGWVDNRRDFGDLIFIDLRDSTGIMQIVFDKEKFQKDFSLVESLRNEYVVCIEGTVVSRADDAINKNLKTGNIEVSAEKIKILSKSEPLPFSIHDDRVNDNSKLSYRYLDLRRNKLQENLKLRNEVYKTTRNYLDRHDFIEIETPMLGKSTPEGARDYLVPSRMFPNHFFALPQSPQLYKQLLMLSGIDRYFQIAKCFRDEDLRADRQPEFTQIDLEMGFVSKETQVMILIEGLISELFKNSRGIKLKTPFAKMTYKEAMDSYGTDKPDVRFDFKIRNMSDIAKDSTLKPFKNCVDSGGSVRTLNGNNMFDKLTRKDIDKLAEFVKDFGAPGLSYATFENGIPKSPLVKFFTKNQFEEIFKRNNMKQNDILFFIADEDDEIVLKSLGKLRIHLAEKFDLIDKTEFAPLWVTDFPLFEYNADERRYAAKHHPFTAPKDEDIKFLESNKEKARAKAYDIVINGYEVGGGSIRISSPELQNKMFKALGFSEQRIKDSFGFFVDGFKYGAPPHGGIALGVDRLTMLLTGSNDIKDVIAFPKIQSSMDPLTKAPSYVSKQQLKELHISLEISKKEVKSK